MTQAPSTSAAICPRCGMRASVPLLCEACGVPIDALAATTYFELLGLPAKFQVEERQITAAYRAIARAIHPDRFSNETESARETANRNSARLNQAYHVLRDPILRADYLLNLHGGPSAAELREVPGALLAEVMSMREAIETAKSSTDASILEQLRKTVEARRKSATVEIASLAAGLPGLTDSERRELRKLINSMKYFDNLLDELAGDPLNRSIPAHAS